MGCIKLDVNANRKSIEAIEVLIDNHQCFLTFLTYKKIFDSSE